MTSTSTIRLVIIMLLAKEGRPYSMQLHLMQDKVAEGAVCLDGSPAGFYYWNTNSQENTHNWHLTFEGGGWCYDDMDCYGRSQTRFGSTSRRPMAIGGGAGLTSPNCTVNPDFCLYNMVYILYCDGNSFTGDRDKPLVVKGKPLYFRGRRIIDAMLDTLKTIGLQNAENVLLSGGSAGGLAAILQADHIHNLLKERAPNLKVFKVLPYSGIFLNQDNLLGEPVFERQMRNIFEMSNSSHGMNDACIAAHPQEEHWKCMFAKYTYPHLEAPVMVINSAYDQWQTGCVLGSKLVAGFPYQTSTLNGMCNVVGGWGACVANPENCNPTQMARMNKYITDFMADLTAPETYRKNGNGAFIHSCHTHVEGIIDPYWIGFKVRNVTMRDAVSKWWHSDNAPSSENTYEPCLYSTGRDGPRACNPTCLHPGASVPLPLPQLPESPVFAMNVSKSKGWKIQVCILVSCLGWLAFAIKMKKLLYPPSSETQVQPIGSEIVDVVST